MVMNNDGSGGLFQANSLESPARWEPEIRALIGKVDCLFTNPPFGSKIPVDDPAILENYALGHSWSYNPTDDTWHMTAAHKAQPPEVLFIERCLKFLRPGTGIAAMVIPDGILGSPGQGYVRAWLLKHARILASIDMHPDTFQPSTSVQTSILVFQRKTDHEIEVEEAAGHQNDYDIFMALGNHIGHDKRGTEVYKRDPQGHEIVEEYEQDVREYEDGRRVVRKHKSLRKVRDDNTDDIAEAYRSWLPLVMV